MEKGERIVLVKGSIELDLVKALAVMTLDPKIRLWLEANDPKALEQANRALDRAGFSLRGNGRIFRED